MAGFREFAREAASGSRMMVPTRSARVPEGYASTTEAADDLLEAADDLLEAVGGEATPGRVDRGGGRFQALEFRKGAW